ncbi:hypothetical protein C8T65DRAFT_249048 [Cerioporus squamosus]|nr:hypothetical protein C8T65DRAFT_249048 [Cerioporus squamosus]
MHFPVFAALAAAFGAVGAMAAEVLSPTPDATLPTSFYFKYVNQDRSASDPKYATALQVSLRNDTLGFHGLSPTPRFSDADPTVAEGTVLIDRAAISPGDYLLSVNEAGPSGYIFSTQFPVTVCPEDSC